MLGYQTRLEDETNPRVPDDASMEYGPISEFTICVPQMYELYEKRVLKSDN